MSKKNKNGGKKPAAAPAAPTAPETAPAAEEKKAVSVIVEQFNKAYSKPRENDSRIIDVIRVRKDHVSDDVLLTEFLFNIGGSCHDQGKNVFLDENESSFIIWETVEEGE